MPAINTDSGARAAQPKKKLVRKKPAKATPKPTTTQVAAQQEQQYASQGQAVEHVANQQKARTPPAKQPRRKPAAQDTYRAPAEQQYLSQAHSVRIQANIGTRIGGTSPVGDRPQNRARDMTSPAVQAGVKKARIRVLNQRKAGSGVKIPGAAVKALADVGAKLGDVAGENIRKRGPGGSAVVPTISRSEVTPTKLAVNAAKDAATFPSQAITSTADLGAGVVEAVQGRPQRLKRIAQSVDQTDPLYNAAAAGVAAVTGDSAAAKKRWTVAKKNAAEHPLLTGLEVVGVKGAVGRGIGKVARTGVAGQTVKAAAGTARAPKTLPGTNLTSHREYTGDVFGKVGQVLSDRTRKPNLTMSVRDINKRVDERVGATGTDVQPFVNEFAATHSNGKVRAFSSPKQAARAADRIGTDTGHEFVPVKFGDAHAIVPKTALERLAEHRDVMPKTTFGRTVSLANDSFRKTVLSTSTSWAAGNVIEAGMRGALNKTGPRSWLAGHQLQKRVKALDPVAGEELAARITGGGHYSLAEATQIKDVAQHFAGTAVEPMANALHNWWAHPAPHAAAKVWKTWNAAVFRGMGKVEGQFQKAQLGAAVRKSELMDGHLFKLSNAAMDEAARGLTSTETQVRFARAVERAYGKYRGFSPSTRMAIAHYSPFVAWFANAVKFVGDTLPRDHPLSTAVIAAAEQADQEWRGDHGLDLWMDGSVPGWLQGSFPTTGGGKRRISKFTPFGAFGDLGGTLSSQVLPLYSGPIMALKGLDWNGRKLRTDGPEGAQQVHNALTAIGQFIDATIPVVSQAKRVGDKGAAALNPFATIGGTGDGGAQAQLSNVRAQMASLRNRGKDHAKGSPYYTPEYTALLDQQKVLSAQVLQDSGKPAKIRLKRFPTGGNGRIKLGGQLNGGGRITLGVDAGGKLN